MRPLLLLVLSMVALLPLGCGSKGPQSVKVSGRVTLDNRPLANARVIFLSVGADGNLDPNKEASGNTNDDGRYSLKTLIADRDGAAPGPYRVQISRIERGESLRELVPPQYNRESKLNFTVPPEGTEAANFELKSP